MKPAPIRQDVARLVQLREELATMAAVPEVHAYRFISALIELTLDQEARLARLEREIKTLRSDQ
jgi:hypothetical protein